MDKPHAKALAELQRAEIKYLRAAGWTEDQRHIKSKILWREPGSPLIPQILFQGEAVKLQRAMDLGHCN